MAFGGALYGLSSLPLEITINARNEANIGNIKIKSDSKPIDKIWRHFPAAGGTGSSKLVGDLCLLPLVKQSASANTVTWTGDPFPRPTVTSFEAGSFGLGVRPVLTEASVIHLFPRHLSFSSKMTASGNSWDRKVGGWVVERSPQRMPLCL